MLLIFGLKGKIFCIDNNTINYNMYVFIHRLFMDNNAINYNM